MKKFTLIELLVVVAIIGILAAMILPALGTARDKAQQKTCTNNLKQMGTAMIMYFSDGTETLMPTAAGNYFQADDAGGAATDFGALWELEYGTLSCGAKRDATSGANDKVYTDCASVAGNSFSAVEDPQTRIATDAVAAGTADTHTSGGKANVLAGDGHVEATTSGTAQVNTTL